MTSPRPTLAELEAMYASLERMHETATRPAIAPAVDPLGDGLALALRLIYREIVAAATAETVAARKTGPGDDGAPDVGPGVTPASKHLAPVAPAALAKGWSESELSEAWGYGS